MKYYQNTNPDWVPLFKQFMESKGINRSNYDFRCKDLYYYVNSNGVIDTYDINKDVSPILFNPTMITEKEIKIDIPSGYEIDRENSTFECIKFKKKELTYDDIAKSLFKNDYTYYIVDNGMITHTMVQGEYIDPNNGTSKKQLKKLLAINKLMNIAKYFNSDWEPKFGGEKAYYIYKIGQKYYVSSHVEFSNAIIYFKLEEDAKQAIKIMGKDLDLIYSTDW